MLFRLFHFCLMCMNVLLACLYVYHMYAWCPQRSEEDVGPPRNDVYRQW